MRRLPVFLLSLLLLSTPAHAQEDNAALAERLERLERDLNFVQKQVYRGGSGDVASGGTPIQAGSAQVRFTQIEEEMRQIRGLIEQHQFQQRQAVIEMKKLSDDVDFRLRALEQQQAQLGKVEGDEATPPQAAVTDPAQPAPAPAVAEKTPETDSTKPAEYKPESKEKPAATGKDFPDSNAHYSHAFKLLNEKKFSEAATSFDAFVKKYPSDPLTANAFYWLGESQYARNDFTRSAESFRKGFEVSPEGNKAADNLYKLAMSLSQVRRKNEACIVLGRVIEKFSESAARTSSKAEEARATMQCK
jgi:tol-pal system protein YbgF